MVSWNNHRDLAARRDKEIAGGENVSHVICGFISVHRSRVAMGSLEKPEGGFEFEANVDEIQLCCAADGNPAPNIFWRKAGGESILR